jgi:hypothetical protein
MGYIGLGKPDVEDLNKVIRKLNEHTKLLEDIQKRLLKLEELQLFEEK